jgi:hypothetical protein
MIVNPMFLRARILLILVCQLATFAIAQVSVQSSDLRATRTGNSNQGSSGSESYSQNNPNGWDLLTGSVNHTTKSTTRHNATPSKSAGRTSLSLIDYSVPPGVRHRMSETGNLTTGTAESKDLRDSAIQSNEIRGASKSEERKPQVAHPTP